MPQPGSVIGDIFETFKEEGKKTGKEVFKEIAKAPINILEGLNPVNPAEVQEKSKMYKEQDKIKLAKVKSGLDAIRSTPPEQSKPQQGAELAEKGSTNQNASMNNLQGQPLSSSMTPKKKMEPLPVQQKRNNKLHGAG